MEFILNENVLTVDVQPGAGFMSSQRGGLTRKKKDSDGVFESGLIKFHCLSVLVQSHPC